MPQGPEPTGTVAVTVADAPSSSETLFELKLLTAATRNEVRQVSGGSHRPARQASTPLQTSPSLHGAPSGSTAQSGEQQSPESVLPSSHCSPASTLPSPQRGGGIVVLVVVVLVVVVLVVDVVVVDVVVVVVVVVLVVVDVVVVVVVVLVVVGGGQTRVVVVVPRADNSIDGTHRLRRRISFP
jgi:hypothetical protein